MAMLAAVGAHPIRLFLILWAVAAALFGVRPVMIPSPLRRAAAAIAGALGLLSLLAFATWYVVQPTYLDPIEPSVTAVAWVWLRGGEMYPSVDGPLGYGQLYGPVTYLAQAAALRVFGASVIASKAVGLAVLIAVCAAL